MEPSVGKALLSLSMSTWSLPLRFVLQAECCLALTNLNVAFSSAILILNNLTCDFMS